MASRHRRAFWGCAPYITALLLSPPSPPPLPRARVNFCTSFMVAANFCPGRHTHFFVKQRVRSSQRNEEAQDFTMKTFLFFGLHLRIGGHSPYQRTPSAPMRECASKTRINCVSRNFFVPPKHTTLAPGLCSYIISFSWCHDYLPRYDSVGLHLYSATHP